MPIFGQVWLWSSLAFLLGALLCWAIVALPARRRVGELESSLARARRQPPERPEPRRSGEDEREGFDPLGMVPGMEPDDEVHNEPLTRAYAMSGTRVDAPGDVPPRNISGAPSAREADTELSVGPRASATQYLNVSGSGSLAHPTAVPAEETDRGWFDDDEKREKQAEQRADTPEEEDVPPATTVLPKVPAEPVEDDRLVEDGRLVDDSDESDGTDGAADPAEPVAVAETGTVFTQRTHPIPGELIRQLDDAVPDESSREPSHRLAAEPAGELVDDLADDVTGDVAAPGGGVGDGRAVPELAEEPTILTEPAVPGESKHQLTEEPAVPSTQSPAGPAQGAHDRTEVVPAHTAVEQTAVVSASGRPGAASDQSTPGAEEPKIMPGVNVQSEPSQNQLPKRVPSKPPQRTPFGVRTSTPAAPPPAPSSSQPAPAESASDASRSLFEPIVPAGDPPATPPPHRMRGLAAGADVGGASNGRGPFGPGSAMPLPGGASPSPEYTIKASASAMRYCTPDSDVFGRTVAEVWFRSAADAERVGFRPIS